MTWEEERNRRYHFRNIYHSDVLTIDRIHPLQQKIVINIIEKISNLGITKIVVIGSSLNLRCNPWSDLDIVLYGHLDGLQRANVEMKILSNVDGKIDMLWMQDIKNTNRIIEDIRRGVVVYEQIVTEGKGSV